MKDIISIKIFNGTEWVPYSFPKTDLTGVEKELARLENEKLANKGKQFLDGDLVVKGNLNVSGKTVTTDQETLTIKDNFIAVNGNETSLDIADMAGILTLSGKHSYVLKSGQYKFNIEKINELLNIKWADPTSAISGIYDSYDHNFKNKFNSLAFTPSKIEFEGKEITDYDRITLENMDCVFYLTFDVVQDPVWDFYDLRKLGEIWEKTISYDDNYVLTFENQIVNKEDFEFVISVLLKQDGGQITLDDFEMKGLAYASPIFDKNEDALKIGLGTYVKDGNGNIVSFEFFSGQGQNLATRDNNIEDGALLKWDSVGYKLVSAGLPLIKGGSGQYSIITIEEESMKNQAFGRASGAFGRRGKAYQKASFTFGDDNKSGRTKQEFNDYYWDDTDNSEIFETNGNGKLKDVISISDLSKFNIVTQNTTMYITGLKDGADRRLHDGQGLIILNANNLVKDYANELKQMGIDPTNISGYYAFVTDNVGFVYEIAYGASFTTGVSNTTLSRGSLTGGEGNYNEGSHSFVFGRGLKNLGNYSIVLGGENGYEGKTKPIVTNDGNFNFIFGKSLAVNKYNRVILLGDSLKATNDNQIIIGKNSGGKHNTSGQLRFAVGTGTNSVEGTNGFEVYEGGSVRAYKVPKLDEELVRLAEIKPLMDNMADITGQSNLHSLIFNLDPTKPNTNTGKNSIVAGQKSNNTAFASMALGSFTENNGDRSFLFGTYIYPGSNNGPRIKNNGCGNVMIGAELYSFGGNDWNLNRDYCTLLGYSLYPLNNFCTIVGSNSITKETNTYWAGKDLKFAVATGELFTSTRRNSLSVYGDGSVRVPKTPEKDEEVARLKEVKDLETYVDKELNDKVSAYSPASNNTTYLYMAQKKSDGTVVQTVKRTSASVMADVIPITGAGGTLRIGTPTASEHAATKGYVDNLVANASGEKLYKHTVSFVNISEKLVIISTDNTPIVQGVNPEENSVVWAQTPDDFMDTIRNVYLEDDYDHKYQAQITIGETNIPNIIKMIGYYNFGSLQFETIVLPYFERSTVVDL